jgi:tripartite-type tricarboxylate transporter receptor subunit TctC
VDRLNRETLAVLRSPDVSERLTTVGFDIVTSRPDEFAAYIRAEVAKWNKLVKQIGIKAG